MTEVLRRVQDLLVGDVVAHEGRARKVERVGEDTLTTMLGNGTVITVLFEDSEERWSGRLMMNFKQPSKFTAGTRLLLLESHYSAASGGE